MLTRRHSTMTRSGESTAVVSGLMSKSASEQAFGASGEHVDGPSLKSRAGSRCCHWSHTGASGSGAS